MFLGFSINSYYTLGIIIGCSLFIIKNYRDKYIFLYIIISSLLCILTKWVEPFSISYSLLINSLLLLLSSSKVKTKLSLSPLKDLLFIIIISLGQSINIFAPITALFLSSILKLSIKKYLPIGIICFIPYATSSLFYKLDEETLYTVISSSIIGFVSTSILIKLLYKKSFLINRSLAFSFLIFSLIFFYKHSRLTHQSTIQTMGTQAKIIAQGQDKKVFKEAMNKILNRFNTIEYTLSSYNKNSELNYINNNASKKALLCSPILWENLIAAQKAYHISEGVFDITIEPLLKLWGLKFFKRKSLPSSKELAHTVNNLGFDKIVIDKDNKTIFFTNHHIKLNFGGLTKGYAVDQAVTILKNYGFKNILVNLGGNIRVVGKKETIGIRRPHNNDLSINLNLQNEAISTSGNYQRFVTIDGKQYNHIINPKTGIPVEYISSVSIVAPTALWADILSTTLFLIARDNKTREDFLNKTSAMQAFFIEDNQANKTHYWSKQK